MSSLPLPDSGEALEAARLPAASDWLERLQRIRGRLGDRLGYALADQVVYSFGNMVVAALVSRHCAQQEFGCYILTQRAMDIFIQVSNVLLWAPFTFNLPGTPERDRATYLGSVFNLQVLLCLLFTLLIWFGAHCSGRPGHADLQKTLIALIATAGGILFREFTRRMYFSQMRFREAFWTDAATVALQIGATVWLWRTHHLHLWQILGGLCAGALVVSGWWLLRDGKTLRLSAAETWKDLRRSFRLGRWFLGSNMVSLAGSQCNPWVLSAVVGSGAVGAYAVCESVVNIPRVAFTSMQNVMGPMLARAEVEEGKAGVRLAVKRLDRAMLAASAGACVAVLVWGPAVSQLIFKTTASHARAVLLILALNLVAITATLAQSYGLTALGRVDRTFYANVLGLLVQALACVFLIRRFDVPGAAVSMLVGSVVVLVVRQLYFSRAVRQDD